jgi:hypothetical protein
MPKLEKKQIYTPTTGKFSQHDITSLNGERLCSFAAGNNMVIASTYFKHKQIHQATWKIPGNVGTIQIDRVLVNNRRKSAIQDVRVFRGANCDADHYLVIVKVRQKLVKVYGNKAVRVNKWNVEALED